MKLKGVHKLTTDGMEFHPPQLKDLGQSEEEIVKFLEGFGYLKSGKYAEVFSLKK